MKFRVEGIYDAKKLGIPQMLILGLQHMFAMFGATILVPILVNNYFHGEGLSIQVTLFCAGFGTLLFHVLTKLKVPAFLGSSFAFLGGFATVAELDTGIFANMSYGEKLSIRMRRCICSRSSVPGTCPDCKSYRRKTCYALSAASCNRPDHHLHRT